MATEISERILHHLQEVGDVDSFDFAKLINEDHRKIIGAVKSLQTFVDLICVEVRSSKVWEVTDEGKLIVQRGSHEMQVYKNVPPEGITLSRLMECIPDRKITTVGFNKAMSSGWLCLDKSQSQPIVRRKLEPKVDTVQEDLKCIVNNNSDKVDLAQRQDYKKRKLLNEVVVTSYMLRKGPSFTTELVKEANDLTVDMLTAGSWKKEVFKSYNFNALGTSPTCGYLHPLLKVREQVRQIFLEMGFTEMPTNNYIESSFWNFDALFQPQQHPARDAHDTFFVSHPSTSCGFPQDYLKRVKKVHSEGGYGSQGYGYEWKEDEATKNLLRTHTTAVSARMLYKLAQEGFQPAKYFSIDRVFRNETLDATHLAEFQQVEGVVADYNLTLGNLIGILSVFFRKLGMEQLQFKPAYNPYTEPSMEIFSYHVGLGKWIEVGNSGVFRPEMLLPMGLPPDVNVIAWGLSLERPTMIKYGLNNIRDLVGPRVDLKMVHENPLCRLDKECSSLDNTICGTEDRCESVISQLNDLSSEIKALSVIEKVNIVSSEDEALHEERVNVSASIEKVNIVISANPNNPPYSFTVLFKILSGLCGITGSQHVHSSISVVPPPVLSDFASFCFENSVDCKIVYTLIWKNVEEVSLVESPASHVKILGETNGLRYLCRLVESCGNGLCLYEGIGLMESAHVDSWLDQMFCAFRAKDNASTAKFFATVSTRLEKHNWLVGVSPSAADIALWSSLKQTNALSSYPDLTRWLEKCRQHPWFDNLPRS